MAIAPPSRYTKAQLEPPTAATIRKQRPVHGVLGEGIGMTRHRIDLLKAGEYLDAAAGLIRANPARFFKDGPLLMIDENHAKTPEEKFLWAREDSLAFRLAGYGWKGTGADQRTRVVSLVQILNGAKSFAYDPSTAFDRIYDGGECIEAVITVPSDGQKLPRYTVRIDNFPQGPEWQNLRGECSCGLYRFRHVRQPTERDPTDRLTFCKHMIAACYKIMKAEYHERPDVLRYSPILIPSQTLVDFYRKLERNAVNHRQTLNDAEKETLLWSYIDTYPERSLNGPGKLADRKW
jgi:hypothetical protein